MRNLILTTAVLAVSLMAGHALAGDQPAPAAAPASAPPPGPGLDLINEHCKFCHVTAQVFIKKRSADEWDAVMQTMIDRGAELSPEESKVITDYLNAHYGTGAS